MPREAMAVLDRRRAADTARAIRAAQHPSGWIPWFPGGHVDPWNMVEAAMALDAGGFHGEAARAYSWLGSVQREDGAWAAAYRDGVAADPLLDANFTSYLAVGVWHHYLVTGDGPFLARMRSHVERCMAFVLELQRSSGAFAWARDAAYRPAHKGLLAGTSCMHLSLRCAALVAEETGDARPDWELAADRAAAAVITSPNEFEDKRRYAMDWYYPVLAGVVPPARAGVVLDERWDTFVEERRGCRCVSDRPWVTAGESAELALSLCAAGRDEDALAVMEWLDYLRDDDGMYWTGATWPEGVVWPREKTTWSAGAVLLAAAALGGDGPTATLFAAARGSLDPVGDPL